MTRLKRYRYVGPAEILAQQAGSVELVVADTRSALDTWLEDRRATGLDEPATFVVDLHSTALDRLGMPHPGGFTAALTFRRCTACGERNIVRDGDFSCALCDGALPTHWNFDPA